MKIAYIILCYKFPSQVRLLIDALQDANNYFFVHIDRNVDSDPFYEALSDLKNIFWVDREYSYWGSYQCVKALINGLTLAFENKDVNFDYFIHLSGQDLPLKKPEFINYVLSRYIPTNFITLNIFPVGTWNYGGIDRLKKIKFFWKGKRIILSSFSRNWFIRVFHGFIMMIFSQIDKRKTFYGGEFYFMLHRTGVHSLLKNIRNYPLFFNRLKYVTLPEEIVIHTMLMINYEIDKLIICDDKFRFMDWSCNQKSPKEIDELELRGLFKSSFLFGRKFSIKNDKFRINFDL
ncbi:beta-1,6-N-acetylglucosaminyltransferase [Algoriphagus marincola]|uniref:beta-1,6-N-acetylglucosaminyltransferase n=1 Tax=Algoriphagus marincola TaxID=264027 RepID=UPI00041DD781|nr:beta-1,6-N-acetylglucosaminyltransferase [Algoriphagus marincola]